MHAVQGSGAGLDRRAPHLIWLVWPIVLLVLLQTLISGASLYALSAVRAYVAGESLWSKGQKDAIYYLQRYGITHKPEDYQGFLRAIDIPRADREFRQELDKPVIDVERVRQAALRGGGHPDDLNRMIWLYRHFHDVGYFKRAVGYWSSGDQYLDQLIAVGESLRQDIATGGSGSAALEPIHAINLAVTSLEHKFSATLGEASRMTVQSLLLLNAVSCLTLIALAIWRTRNMLCQERFFRQRLDDQREWAQTTLAAIGDGVITLNRAEHIAYLNPAAERMLGRPGAEVAGLPLESLLKLMDELTGEESPPMIDHVLRGDSEGGCESGKAILRPDGSTLSVKVVTTPIRAAGEIDGAVLVLHDVTPERQYLADLSWQATHDSLTGLTNRREFDARLAQVLGRAAQQNGPHTLLYLDLDQFKLVNDTCGHAAGDQLLRQVCEQLRSCLREGDTLARLGGDEFGVLLEDSPPVVAEWIAEQLRRSIQGMTFVWAGRSFRISVSIGVMHVSAHVASVEEALRCADLACYMSKEKGRNRVQVFSPEDAQLNLRYGEMAWAQRIGLALEEERFCLYAQPIYPANPDVVGSVHVELLLRLHDEDGRLVAPIDFIPAAERFGLMPQLDRWVVRNAFEILAARAADGHLDPIETCAINLSGSTIGDATFIDYLRALQPQYGVEPGRICFEITETSAIADLSSATQLVRELKALGYRFSLDDFCAGMSSFAYLKHLPVDYLKIDGSFVRDMLADPINRAMVQIINQIGHVMGKRTVAEFVESQEILDALREIGIDYVQGYALAKPRPFNRATRLGLPERGAGLQIQVVR